MIDRFSEDARAALVAANEEATLLGSSVIGPEHILLGLLRRMNSSVLVALMCCGADPYSVRSIVRAQMEPVESCGPPVFSRAAREVLVSSLDQALRVESQYVRADHVLLATVGSGDPIVESVLRVAGCSARHVHGFAHAAVVSSMFEPPAASPT